MALPLAMQVARIREPIRWLAMLIAYATLGDLVRWGISLSLAEHPTPYSGLARLAFHVHTAALWGWLAGVPALTWRTFRRTSPRWIFVLYGVALLPLLIAYPSSFTRGRSLGWAYAVAHWVSLAISLYAAATWIRSSPHPEIEHRAALWVIAFEATLLAGPYLPTGPDPFGHWLPADLSYLCLYITLTAVLGAYLWKHPKPSAGPAPSYSPFRLH